LITDVNSLAVYVHLRIIMAMEIGCKTIERSSNEEFYTTK
jgi:hypothetical protein